MNYMRIKISMMMCMALLTISFTACSEQDEEEEFSNWEAKNTAFIDSIAKVARTNAEGNWSIYKAYILGDSTALYNGQNEKFIYVQKLENGNGTMHPLFTDSVRVHYFGQLIPSKTYPQGYNFDKSYVTDVLNEETDVPAAFGVSGNIVGFATALQYMVEGDRWKVYIPYQLGYGKSDASTIPGYSALIFDVKLARVYRKGTYNNTDWY